MTWIQGQSSVCSLNLTVLCTHKKLDSQEVLVLFQEQLESEHK
jgi:hypothetical protein